MSTRLQIASWLHIAAGALIAALVSVLWVCAALLAPTFEGTFIPDLVAMFGRPVAVALLAFTGLEVAAAIALLRKRTWAPYALVGVSIFQLAVFPIGTALSLYTLWALVPRPPKVHEEDLSDPCGAAQLPR